MTVIVIVTCYSVGGKQKFGAEGILLGWKSELSCPQVFGMSKNINQHILPSLPRLLQACSCLLAAVCSCSGIAEGN